MKQKNQIKQSIKALWSRVKKWKTQPGIRYYTSENSEFAKGAKKVEHGGIDHFGEK